MVEPRKGQRVPQGHTAGFEHPLLITPSAGTGLGPVGGWELSGGAAYSSRLPRGQEGGLAPPQTQTPANLYRGAQGRAGKPQFITKMENDTSLRASPGEELIYDCAGAGTFVSAAQPHAVCGGINSRVISHQRERCPADRLFAVIYYKGAPTRQWGCEASRASQSPSGAPACWPPFPQPCPAPTADPQESPSPPGPGQNWKVISGEAA